MHSARLFTPLAAILIAALPSALADRSDAPPQAPAAPALQVTVPTYSNRTCPIMAKPASRVMFADTANGRIYVCCPPCIKKILADPGRAYKTAYPLTRRAGNTVCPVTDKPLGSDATSVVLQGYEIGVCATCADRARREHQITLAKALDPKITEIRNRTDPTNDQPVTANDFCVIGKELVHLSSPRSLATVRADPAKALAAAKKIVARQEAEGAQPAPPDSTPR